MFSHAMNPHVLNELRCAIGVALALGVIVGARIGDYRRAKRARSGGGLRRYLR
jgi:hypothetical protein